MTTKKYLLPSLLAFSSICLSVYPTDIYASSKNHQAQTIKLTSLEREINSLKRQIHTLKVDYELLEERTSLFEEEFKKWKSHDFDLLASSLQKNSASASNEKVLEQLRSQIDEVRSQDKERYLKLKSSLETLAKALDISIGSNLSSSKVYTVKPGDTLEKIAKRHSTTVKAIKNANQLSSDKIIVGRKLTLP